MLAETESGAWEKSHRLFLKDKKTNLSFLIDTGANISVIPRKRSEILKPTAFKLYAANNTEIATFGEKTLDLDFSLRRPFRWKFIVAAVSKPIIGADFLKHHHLLVDLAGKCLIDKITNLSVKTSICKSTAPTIRTIDLERKYHDILAEFPDITRLSTMKNTPKHNVEHHIETTGPPLYCKARPLPPHRYEAAKKEFQTMMDQGLCRPSKSPWASPLHVVPKPNGDLRVCGDYRRLNAITKPDRYPVPRLKDFTYQLHGKQIFSTLDLNRAYQQLPVLEKHIEKTAIITPFGLFEFPRMCPGLKNAGQTFQRFIHEVLHGLDFAYPFVDDIIISSSTEEEHRQHLRTTLQRLNKYGITINPSKCVLGKKEIKFLGHTVSQDGIKPPAEKVEAITNFPLPTTIEQLRRFLGTVNFYRDCISKAAEIQAPLNAYLHNSKKRDKTKIVWNEKAKKAFELCKAGLQNAALLAHPSHNAPIALMTDASDKCAGAVLQQYVHNKWQPLGYFSKSLSSAQVKYSTYDRELLAIYMAVKHFRKMFEGRHLIIFTDHKPLTYAINKTSSDSETPRRARQLMYISEFTSDIRHISGQNNIVADSLSRINTETITCPTTIDYKQLATAQERDSTIRNLMKQSNLQLKRILVPNTNCKVLCDTSTQHVRPYLPETFRRAAYESVHNMSHPGTRTTRKILSEKYCWPSMNADVSRWTKACEACQKSKVSRHTTSQIATFPPSERFQHIHLDIVGPLPPSQYGHKYLLTIIDRYTRWPEALPLHDITAETIVKTIYEGWITRFGCPITITSDQGRQFESQLFSELMKLMGINRTRTTAYHPQSNGIIERWHRSLKAALTARCTAIANGKWFDELPTVLLGLRAATRSDTGISPAQYTYGTSLRLPGDFFVETKGSQMSHDYVEQLRHTINAYRPAETSHSNNKMFVHSDLRTCDNVYLRRDCTKKPLQPTYEGPYPVLERCEKYYKLQLPGRVTNVSIDRLKPAYTMNEQENDDTQRTTRSGRIVKPVVRFA